tara:strand:+ start:254 stop:853 length:600 start_codon:yes stop_codon:yes gene_type:complete
VSQSFHNRLVGTIVLVALSVVFLPDLLDGHQDEIEEVFPDIVQAPPFEDVDAPQDAFVKLENQYVEGLDHIATISEYKELPTIKSMTVSNPTTKQQPKEKKPVEKQAASKFEAPSQSFSWALQVGTFKDAKNVEKLITQLRVNKLKVYTIPRNIQDNALTKVFVGPDISRKRMIEYQKQVKQLTNTTGVIVKHDPLRSM